MLALRPSLTGSGWERSDHPEPQRDAVTHGGGPLLVLAGPFLDSGDIRGIYIFNVATLQEARELTETDPAIRSGRLEMELHPWYGSAALLKVTEIHKAIWQKEI